MLIGELHKKIGEWSWIEYYPGNWFICSWAQSGFRTAEPQMTGCTGEPSAPVASLYQRNPRTRDFLASENYLSQLEILHLRTFLTDVFYSPIFT